MNPQPTKKVTINIHTSQCVGCGMCKNIAPETFKINDNFVAEVVKDDLTEDELKRAKEAVASCPVQSIEIEDKQ